MYEALPKANASISRTRAHLHPAYSDDKIRDVIGPGGKVIRGSSSRPASRSTWKTMARCMSPRPTKLRPTRRSRSLPDLTPRPRWGKTYLGKVVRLVDFGAFVEIFPGTDGLLHISEVAENRIRDVRDELKEGDQILVKVLALEGNKSS